jgi:uncharacterized protein (TIGR02145 family)
MINLTKEQLKALSNNTFFDNEQGLINPAEHRAFNEALIDSMVLKPEPQDVGYVVYPGDGKRYPVKKINGIWYTVKNHESVVYANGSPISAWSDGSTAQYNDNEGYGKLYSWHVTQQANLCPAGWKVPSKGDFDVLSNALGSTDTEKYNGLISVWKGVLGGYCYSHGTPHSQGSYASYWSSTTDDVGTARGLEFSAQVGDFDTGADPSRNTGVSLRFIITDESLIQYYDQGSAEFVEEDLKPVTYYSGTSVFAPTIDIDFDTPRKLDVFQFKNSGYNNTPIWFALNLIGDYSKFGATKTVIVELVGCYDLIERGEASNNLSRTLAKTFLLKENGVIEHNMFNSGKVRLIVNGMNGVGTVYKKMVTPDTNNDDRVYMGFKGLNGLVFMIKFQFYGQYTRFCTMDVFKRDWNSRSLPS